MSRKIVGVTVGTPLGISAIKEKLNPVTSVNGVEADENGNVEITIPDSGGNVAYDEEQNLTEEQKAQARENIGAQPKGNYLTEVPEGYAKKDDIPSLDGYAKTDDIPTDAEIIQLIKDNTLESSGGGIAVTGAKVGQTVKISAVDENGVPTAWLPTDFPSGGGGKWRQIADITLEEEVTILAVESDMSGSPLNLLEIYVLVDSLPSVDNGFTYINTTLNRGNRVYAGVLGGHTIGNNLSNSNTDKERHYYCYAKFMPGAGCMSVQGVSTQLYNQSASVMQMLQPYNVLYKDTSIERIVVVANDSGKSIGGIGTTVKIWGVDA